MASGTPVVAVREAGPIETVVDGQTGFLVDRDPAMLGEAVLRILGDAPLRSKLGAAGRDHVVSSFSWDRSAEQLSGLLSAAAEARRSHQDETLPQGAVVG
jgi:glycosyltransferase involved in cell wall biosynthesis